MHRYRPLVPLLALLLMLLVVRPAHAQANLQVWAKATINWAKSDRLVYELDVEPKALLVGPEGEPDWRNLDVTPNVEYSPKGWHDLVAEAVTGYTRQIDDMNWFEVSPRVGVRFHVLSRGPAHRGSDTAAALPGASRCSTCGRNRATRSRRGSPPGRTSSTFA